MPARSWPAPRSATPPATPRHQRPRPVGAGRPLAHPRPPGRTGRAGQPDRGWVFGHVIVDEAQELSPMAWRMLMRRSPSRSMTVVGDMAQTGAAVGTRLLGPGPGPPRRRTLAGGGADHQLPDPGRDHGRGRRRPGQHGHRRGAAPLGPRGRAPTPWHLRLAPADAGPAAGLGGVVAAEAAQVGEGKLAVLVPPGRAEELAEPDPVRGAGGHCRQGPGRARRPGRRPDRGRGQRPGVRRRGRGRTRPPSWPPAATAPTTRTWPSPAPPPAWASSTPARAPRVLSRLAARSVVMPARSPMIEGMPDPAGPAPDQDLPTRQFGWWDMFVSPDEDPGPTAGSGGAGHAGRLPARPAR